MCYIPKAGELWDSFCHAGNYSGRTWRHTTQTHTTHTEGRGDCQYTVRKSAILSGKQRRCQGSNDVVREATTSSRTSWQRLQRHGNVVMVVTHTQYKHILHTCSHIHTLAHRHTHTNTHTHTHLQLTHTHRHKENVFREASMSSASGEWRCYHGDETWWR